MHTRVEVRLFVFDMYVSSGVSVILVCSDSTIDIRNNTVELKCVK